MTGVFSSNDFPVMIYAFEQPNLEMTSFRVFLVPASTSARKPDLNLRSFRHVPLPYIIDFMGDALNIPFNELSIAPSMYCAGRVILFLSSSRSTVQKQCFLE